MAQINPLAEDLDILQKLPDVPNLTAKEMQKEFDKSGNIIKDFINSVIVPAINSIIAVTGTTDKTLTVADAPADAKAAGDFIRNLRNSFDTRLLSKLSVSGGDMTGRISMGSNKIVMLGSPTDGADAANKQYVDEARLIIHDCAVQAAAFVEDTTYEDYAFRAAISVAGVTESMIPEVVFPVQNEVGFAPVAETYNGGVHIYADGQPENGITIPTIIFWRGNA